MAHRVPDYAKHHKKFAQEQNSKRAWYRDQLRATETTPLPFSRQERFIKGHASHDDLKKEVAHRVPDYTKHHKKFAAQQAAKFDYYRVSRKRVNSKM